MTIIQHFHCHSTSSKELRKQLQLELISFKVCWFENFVVVCFGVITGPPTDSVGGPVLFFSLASVVCRHLSSVIICNSPWQAYSLGGGPVEFHPIRVTPCVR